MPYMSLSAHMLPRETPRESAGQYTVTLGRKTTLTVGLLAEALCKTGGQATVHEAQRAGRGVLLGRAEQEGGPGTRAAGPRRAAFPGKRGGEMKCPTWNHLETTLHLPRLPRSFQFQRLMGAGARGRGHSPAGRAGVKWQEQGPAGIRHGDSFPAWPRSHPVQSLVWKQVEPVVLPWPPTCVWGVWDRRAHSSSAEAEGPGGGGVGEVSQAVGHLGQHNRLRQPWHNHFVKSLPVPWALSSLCHRQPLSLLTDSNQNTDKGNHVTSCTGRICFPGLALRVC